MKQRLLAAMLACLLLSGCGAASPEETNEEQPETLKDLHSDYQVQISAKTGAGLDELKDILEMILRNRKIYLEKVFSYQEAGRIQTIRKYGQLLKEEYREDGIYVEAYVPTELYAGLMR